MEREGAVSNNNSEGDEQNESTEADRFQVIRKQSKVRRTSLIIIMYFHLCVAKAVDSQIQNFVNWNSRQMAPNVKQSVK